MVNLKQAAKALQRSESWVRQQVRAKRLPVIQAGRERLVRERDLERFAEEAHLPLARDPVVVRLDSLRRELAVQGGRLDAIEHRLASIEAVLRSRGDDPHRS